jgi:hypothetical protein
MSILLEIGLAGWLIIVAQLLVFSLILVLGLQLEMSSRALRSCLSRSLRESRDFVTEDDAGLGLARACATRYRPAVAKIEKVDVYAICFSEVSRATACTIGRYRWSFSRIDDLLHGGPGFLVTLGLIGTFIGLMGNMVKLSELVIVSDTVAQQSNLLGALAAVFPSMAAAFSTSLLGVSLSSILWLVGASNGMLNLKNDIVDLLSGYLEQVVQADCRRYSLVGESMERMEKYLTDYLSQFSSRVSASVEQAIQSNIRTLVSSLSSQVSETKAFVSQVKEGSERLHDAGYVFFKASSLLQETDFAENFGVSCSSFLQSVSAFVDSSRSLSNASNANANAKSSALLRDSVLETEKVIESISTSLALSEKRIEDLAFLAVQSNEQLSSATSSVESIQKRGMTWLSMRAKTDQQLMEINSQLNEALTNVADIAAQVAQTRLQDVNDISSGLASLGRGIAELRLTVQQQGQVLERVIEGLNQMQSVTSRLQGGPS